MQGCGFPAAWSSCQFYGLSSTSSMLEHVGGCVMDPWELVSCGQGAAKPWQIGEVQDITVAP